jgi:hypothetical protein
MKQIYVMADASAEDKALACQEAATTILEYVKANKLEQRVLEALVMSCVSTIAIEAYTRDVASNQARNEIYRDSVNELAVILGVGMEMIYASEVLN